MPGQLMPVIIRLKEPCPFQPVEGQAAIVTESGKQAPLEAGPRRGLARGSPGSTGGCSQLAEPPAPPAAQGLPGTAGLGKREGPIAIVECAIGPSPDRPDGPADRDDPDEQQLVDLRRATAGVGSGRAGPVPRGATRSESSSTPKGERAASRSREADAASPPKPSRWNRRGSACRLNVSAWVRISSVARASSRNWSAARLRSRSPGQPSACRAAVSNWIAAMAQSPTSSHCRPSENS